MSQITIFTHGEAHRTDSSSYPFWKTGVIGWRLFFAGLETTDTSKIETERMNRLDTSKQDEVASFIRNFNRNERRRCQK